VKQNVALIKLFFVKTLNERTIDKDSI